MNQTGILGTFAGHAFLQGLSDRHLMKLASAAQPFRVAPGTWHGREQRPRRST
jgi:hypothetical protein